VLRSRRRPNRPRRKARRRSPRDSRLIRA
jgi:hypothetical protein